MQLDDPDRGFSFLHNGPLDMRMDRAEESDIGSAFSLVNFSDFNTLKNIIAEYGEEPLAAAIAKAIISNRGSGIKTTAELAKIIENAYPPKRRALARRHPATKTFQALRMAVNRELTELDEFLNLIPNYLSPGARLVIISFHSLEDRKVKQAFKQGSEDCHCPKQLPVCVCNAKPVYKLITKKVVIPTPEECIRNPRSSCAKMRVAERR